MSKFKISGQHPLAGTLDISGSKNAATPILASVVLSAEPCTLHHVPRIEDVHRLLELLKSVGVTYAWTDEHTVSLDASSVDPTTLDQRTVRTLRSSVLLMGALLGRCGTVSIPGPGGDQIGARPLDAHLDAFRELHVSVHYDGDTYTLTRMNRQDSELTLSEGSVTATENVILAAVLGEGVTTTVYCAAADPSVQDLCLFLNARGAMIEGIGTSTLRIRGVASLRALDGYAIMPDPVETGTFLSLAAAARAELTLSGAAVPFMRLELLKFKEAGVQFDIIRSRQEAHRTYPVCDIVVKKSSQLRALRKVHNMPYPGFNPDLLQPFAVMLTQANGTSLVHDWMYEGRLKYVEELNKMGAQIFIADPHRILVNGPTNLYGADITSYDIRTGASLFIAALIAAGTSTIGPIYQIERGYEKLDERMRALGAVIERTDG